MNCEQARTQFVDYWRGTLEDAGGEFRDHLAFCERCRAEAEDLKDMWSTLGTLPEQDPSLSLRGRFYDSLRNWRQREAERRQPFAWMRHPAFQAAAAMAILVLGIGAGFLVRGRDSSEISQLRGEVYNMRQLVALSLLQQQNASDRLRGVNYTYRVEPDDPQVLSALLTTINHDPSVNVRLAAVDALRKFTDGPVGRRALVQALGKQNSPLVQIAILDQIVELRERSAASAIQLLESGQDVNPDVKQHAQWALRQLQ
ncbi:MAG: HEAT repeat domain-containing protein [Acidobacteriia bacterium]|nr:HEAT repeat domain-containing protein [Terriglobia bacterium]